MSKTDLISRQAAIDALERTKEKDPKGDIASFYNTITDNKIAVIEALPSAETFELGKWYDFQKGYMLELTTEAFRISKEVAYE